MIYFATPVDGGPIKIGHSNDVDRRVVELVDVYGRPLKVLATMEGDYVREQEIHRQFAPLRLGKTEQFVPAPELMDFIGVPHSSVFAPDVVEAMKRIVPVFYVALKGSEEWKSWVEDAAAHCRLSVSSLIDVAITQYVKSQGFDRRPPER